METINLIDFIGFFTNYYYAIIPSILFLLSLLFTFLDWARVGLLGWVDDFESTYETYFIPWVDGLLFDKAIIIPKLDGTVEGSDSYLEGHKDRKIGDVIKCGKWWKVYVQGYWRYLVLGSEKDALAVSEHVKQVDSDTRRKLAHQPYSYFCGNNTAGTFTTLLMIGFLMTCLFVALRLYSLLPTLTVIVITTVASAFVVRKVVRIGKKLKAHISDPNAHKPKEVADEQA